MELSENELSVIALILDEEEEEQQKKKRKWVHDAWKKREKEGEFITLYKELINDERKFFQYFRMTENCFNILHDKLENHLKKKDTYWRKAITSKERLAVCLRYLATGDSLQTISFSYRLGHSTVQKIVTECCKVIGNVLLNEMMPKPTEEMWESIAADIYTIWNFPNCLGALDGKHITIQAPPNSGSLFYNYKKNFSIVLLALVDAHYNFVAVNIGSYGKASDGGIFARSNLGKALERDILSIPKQTTLPNTLVEVPYVIVGDEAFPLKTYLMRPYPGQNLDTSKRVFNYRLSRTRRIVENAFGILSQKFRIYNRRIQANPKNVDHIVLATCILHNFIKKYDCIFYSYDDPESMVPSKYLQNLPAQGGKASGEAFRVREEYKSFFNSEVGSVSWQNDRI